MLKLVLPKGSLEKATLELFEAADLQVSRDSVGAATRPPSTTPASTRCASCARRRSRGTWPRACSTSASPAGTGSRRPRSDVVSLGELQYSKATDNPVRIVVAVPRRLAGRAASRTCPQGVRVSTEYPELTRRFFAEKGIEADIRLSYGATEAKVPDIVDCIVDITETGRALRAAGLQDHRHDPGLLHRADRQPGGATPTRTSATPCTRSAPCSRACSRPGARCW